MTFSNSPLATHTNISPNSNNPRNRPITKITIHHVAGNLSVEAIGNIFATPNRQTSSNYGIGSDGRVGMYVEERNRAWTSSSAANDHQAVTIEVANSSGGPNWPVNDRAFNALIDLCTCICQRNGIRELVYDGTPNGSLTRHNMFANTVCPGPFLQARFPLICQLVNARITPSGSAAVNIAMNASTFQVPAENIAGRWMMTLPDGRAVLIRDVLETMGFNIGWDGKTNTIIANR